MFDVAIIGGGPAGASCAAFCARAGLRVVIVERETFPREKVCGDCLNPQCWPVLQRLGLADRVRALPHGKLDHVEFIAIDGRSVRVRLPEDDSAEIAVKRSAFDDVMMQNALEAGAEVRQNATVSALRGSDDAWVISTSADEVRARFIVAADGRNSTVARTIGLLPRATKERVALQTHVPLPADFGNRVVLQLLPEGYCGQAPVNNAQLNVCLVGSAAGLPRLREWAAAQFRLPHDQYWRTITPLTRDPISAAHHRLFLVGDAARVVEPFTGDGIYYALRSGELAAQAIEKIAQGADEAAETRHYRELHAAMYRGRLWINQLARAAVLSRKVGSAFISAAQFAPPVLRWLTRRITQSKHGML